MRFVPYAEAARIPNIIVDGAPAAATVLTLSHWPKSGSPRPLRADTSTEIVFNYLASRRQGQGREAVREPGAVSNNHYDEDGLFGVFALVDPETAERYRALLVDAAQAGDFGVYRTREAARLVFTLAAHADARTSPLPARMFDLPYAESTAEIYRALLELVPGVLDDLSSFRPFWAEDDDRLTATERLLAGGAMTLEERPDLDLAIVRVPAGIDSWHPFTVHTRTPASRLLVCEGRRIDVQYRYEGWVQMASRKPAPRVDLAPLAAELNQEERSGGRWTFDGVETITPRLHLEGVGTTAGAGAMETSIPFDSFQKRLETRLREGRAAWDPYD